MKNLPPITTQALLPDSFQERLDSIEKQLTAWRELIQTDDKDTVALSTTGWIPVRESWNIVSWDSTTSILVVGTPGANESKYTAGNRVRMNIGVNESVYGIIHAVTDTGISILLKVGTNIFVKDIISAVYFSLWRTPLGFPMRRSNWTFTYLSSAQTHQGSPTANVWYNLGGSLKLGSGSWKIWWKVIADAAASGSIASPFAGLGTANNSIIGLDYQARGFSGTTRELAYLSQYIDEYYITVSDQTLYLNLMVDISGATDLWADGNYGSTKITAVSGYL